MHLGYWTLSDSGKKIYRYTEIIYWGGGMAEPVKPKKICPNCFAHGGVSVVLEKKRKTWVCPKCGTRYKEDENGFLKKV